MRELIFVKNGVHFVFSLFSRKSKSDKLITKSDLNGYFLNELPFALEIGQRFELQTDKETLYVEVKEKSPSYILCEEVPRRPDFTPSNPIDDDEDYEEYFLGGMGIS